MDENDAFAPFWGHVEELRRTLLRVLTIIALAILVSFICYEPLISILKKPLVQATPLFHEKLEYIRIHNTEFTPKEAILPEKSLFSGDLSHGIGAISGQSYLISPGGSLVYAVPTLQTQELVLLSPLEGILIALKVSFWVGIFASSPIWLFLLASFFLPGLHQGEKKLVLPFIIASLLFVTIGCLFAYFVTIPIANQYLAAFNEGMGQNLWSLGNYLDYTLFLLLANGIAFELGVIGIFAVQLKLLSAETLKRNRRFAILGAFVLAAILTPPDVLTQFMLAIPLIALYESLIIYARFLTFRNMDVN